MPITEAERLRGLLGEVVPPGGTADDTLFSDETIEDLLTNYPDLEDATREGWKLKAAELANLVDTAESGASRKMSSLHDNAMKMVKFYGGDTATVLPGEPRGRVKIGKIVRRDPDE